MRLIVARAADGPVNAWLGLPDFYCLGEMRRKKTKPEDLLAAVAAAADDGFCLASSLGPGFRGLGHRELVRLWGRAVRNGLLLERRGPDGRVYLALTSEGWRALRSAGEG